jgi:hypothetical protein
VFFRLPCGIEGIQTVFSAKLARGILSKVKIDLHELVPLRWRDLSVGLFDASHAAIPRVAKRSEVVPWPNVTPKCGPQ